MGSEPYYTNDTRGIIRNREYANQVRDFSGLRFGNITPTDVDGMIEYKNICYVYIETKYESAELPFGQRLALERQTDDMQKVKPTLTVIASHNSQGDIDVANTTVTEYRFMGKWRTRTTQTTTFELVDRFINWVENGAYLK
jgi:hypothetical protein